jgi:hypothetical protein
VQLVDVVANANPAAQKLQLDPVKAPLVWYFPFSQLLQPRLMDALGAVVSYVPATHVAWLEHETEATLCCAWYVDPVQAVQLVDLVSKAKPAEQNLQLLPVNVVNV